MYFSQWWLPGCLKTCLPGLGWNNLTRDVGLCIPSRTKFLKVGSEAQEIDLGFSSPSFSRGAVRRASCPVGREYFLEGAKGSNSRHWSSSLSFSPRAALGLSHFRRASGKMGLDSLAAPAAPTLLGPISGVKGRGGGTELEVWAWGW